MSWHPNDLVSDVDLLDYEATILSTFGKTSWLDKRRRVLADWLFPILGASGFTQERFRTRFEADTVLGYTASAYSDVTDAASSTTADDIDLAAIFATPANDALYIGSSQVFRGLSIRMLEAVSAVTGVLSVASWNDGWTPLVISDDTQKTSGISFSGGGSVTWRVPEGWVKRTLNGSNPRYWVRVKVSAVPTSATATQIGVIRQSVFCAPVTLRTLELIMREAPAKNAGPWLTKADYYQHEADLALDRALKLCGGEFEAEDTVDDLIDAEEAQQTTAEVARVWRLERG